MKTHIKRVHPDQTVIHNIEGLSQEEAAQTVEHQGSESLNVDDVITAGADIAAATSSMEADDGGYDLQLYAMQDAM